MSETLLPMKLIKTFRITMGDEVILTAAARDLKITEAEVVRIALRRFALLDERNGLKLRTVNHLRTVCAGLPIGPASAPVAAHPPDSLADRIAREEADSGAPIHHFPLTGNLIDGE